MHRVRLARAAPGAGLPADPAARADPRGRRARSATRRPTRCWPRCGRTRRRSTPRPSTARSRCSRSSGWCGTPTSATALRRTTRRREHEHFHLVCRNCHRVISVDPDVLDSRHRPPRRRPRLHRRHRPPDRLRDLRGLLDDRSPLLVAARRRRRRRASTRRSPRTTARCTASSATLEAGEGFVDLSHHDVVRISGPDRLHVAARPDHAVLPRPARAHLDAGADPEPAGPRRARLRRRSTTARRSPPRPSPAGRRRSSSSSTGCGS